MYKISIIVPVYNVEKYIIGCLTSISRQTYKGLIECIIVDDCGSDASIQLAEAFVREYSGNILFTILHHESNKGLSGARNTGLKAATGDYVFFLDSDDEISDDCIERLAEPLSTCSVDFVMGNIRVLGTDKDVPKLKLEEGIYGPNEIIARERLIGKWYQMAWNKLYNRHFLESCALLFYEGIIHEDELWSAEIALVANTMCVVNKETYYYNVRSESIMTSMKMKKRLDSFEQIIKEFASFIVENNLQNNMFPRLLIYNLFSRIMVQINKEYEKSFNLYYGRLTNILSEYKIAPCSFTFKDKVKNFHFTLSEKIGALYMKLLLK